MGDQAQQNSMPDRTSISLSTRVADELYDRKGRGESYEDVVERLLEKADKWDENAG